MGRSIVSLKNNAKRETESGKFEKSDFLVRIITELLIYSEVL